MIKIIKNPFIIFAHIWEKFSNNISNDELYLKVLYFCRTRTKLNLNSPKRFTEKLQWLKINYNKSSVHTQMVDKYKVREIIANTIGEEYLFPLLGVWENADDININQLPSQFVLKTNHDSGGVWICKDKDAFIEKWPLYKKQINKRLNHNYYLNGREYVYKDVSPRVIAEKYMVDESGDDLKDYKFFCFNGEPKILFCVSDRFKGGVANFDFFDMDLKRLPIRAYGHPNSNNQTLEISNFDKMIEISKKISKGFPHVRVDLYNINGQIYFGEFTFHHDGGFVPFCPEEWDVKLGDYINILDLKK